MLAGSVPATAQVTTTSHELDVTGIVQRAVLVPLPAVLEPVCRPQKASCVPVAQEPAVANVGHLLILAYHLKRQIS